MNYNCSNPLKNTLEFFYFHSNYRSTSFNSYFTSFWVIINFFFSVALSERDFCVACQNSFSVLFQVDHQQNCTFVSLNSFHTSLFLLFSPRVTVNKMRKLLFWVFYFKNAQMQKNFVFLVAYFFKVFKNWE